MADIRLKIGNAWVGVSGYGVQLDIYVATPGYSKTFLTSTPPNSVNGTFGNGVYASEGSYKYITTTGIGTYKIWAELPDDSSVKSNEEEYNFDPDHYEGGGDAFDWNGFGNVPDLIIPAKWFMIQGVHKQIKGSMPIPQVDWDHIVVNTSPTCNDQVANYRDEVTIPADHTDGQSSFSNLKFAFLGSPGNTFYAYVRDHECGRQSNVFEIEDVTGSGGTYGVGTLTIVFPS